MINKKSLEHIKIKISEDDRPIFKESGTVVNVKQAVNKFFKQKYGK
jgi:ribosomal protein L31